MKLNKIYKTIISVFILITSTAYAQELKPLGADDLAFSIKNMDMSVSPADDFYRYASGKWQDRVKRPSHLSSYGVFDIMREHLKMQMKLVVARAGREAANAPKGSPTQLIGDFYNSFMDTQARDAAGIEPIRDLLERVANISNHDELTRFMGSMFDIGGPGLLAIFGVEADLADSKNYATYAAAGSFGVDKKYEDLLRADSNNDRYIAYQSYIENLLKAAGYETDVARRMAKTALEIEAELASAKLTPEEKLDPRNFYHPMTLDQLQEQIPQLNFDIYFGSTGFPKPDRVIVVEPRYFPVLSKMLSDRPIEDFQDYAAFQLINLFKDGLTTKFEEPTRVFMKALTGVDVLPPLEERILKLMNDSLGHPLSQVYVDQYYSEDTRQKALDMVERIKTVFLDRIPSRDWLSEKTRLEALNKLQNFYYRIGYPDKWIDYSNVEIGNSAINNFKNIGHFLIQRLQKQSTGPVVHDQFNDKSTLPIVINAAYSGQINGFEVPAAIQQAPMFNSDADAPIYFCRLGGVIGHEMTHGFDTTGRQFDATGNLRDWWTPEDAKAFDVEAQKLIDQANSTDALPGLKINGTLNVGENMADVGGITLAHEALMRYLEKHPEENIKIDGMTPSQRCFVSWTQMWTWKASEQFIRSIVANDVHPPNEYRAYAPLQHVDAFYKAFNIKEGDAMWLPPSKRVNAW